MRGVNGTATRCRRCADFHSKRQSALQSQRRKVGRKKHLCTVCLEPLKKADIKKGYTMCWHHRVERRERDRNYRKRYSL